MLHSTWPVVYCCLKLDHLCWHISNLEYCIILFCTLCQKLVHAVLPFPDGISTSILINVKSLLMEDVMVMRTTLKQRMSVKKTAMQVLVQKVGTCTTHFLQWKGCMRKKTWLFDWYSDYLFVPQKIIELFVALLLWSIVSFALYPCVPQYSTALVTVTLF